MFKSLFATAAAIASVATAVVHQPNLYTGTLRDSNDNLLPLYSPAKAPAIPLAVRAPYTSAWTSTANNSTL